MRRPEFRLLTFVAWTASAVSCGLLAHDIEVTETDPSPSGEYEAIVYTDMGGGAAGWCDTYVEILQSHEEVHEGTLRLSNDELAERYRRIVFRHSDCGAQLELAWLEPDHLQITYPVHGELGVRVDQKSHSEIVNVRVSYVVRTDHP